MICVVWPCTKTEMAESAHTCAHTHQMQPECTHHADCCPISPCQTHYYCYTYTCCPPALRLWHHPEVLSLSTNNSSHSSNVWLNKSYIKWCKRLSQGTCSYIMFYICFSAAYRHNYWHFSNLGTYYILNLAASAVNVQVLMWWFSESSELTVSC